MPKTFISLGPFITIYDLVLKGKSSHSELGATSAKERLTKCQIQTFEMPVQFKIFLSCSQFHSPSGWVTLTQS